VTMIGKGGETARPAAAVREGPGRGTPRILELPAAISVRQLSEMLQMSTIDVIKRLMRRGIMANINQVVDYDTAAAIVQGQGYEPRPLPKTAQKGTSVVGDIKKQQTGGEESGLKGRPPVVVVMGHVDHGKTSLLDAIRRGGGAAGEVGGITQHIGAYQVEVKGQKITFLDTPGHEAFTAMRARGAQVTDIAILVVAADDGVMPQTLEALGHARVAGVPVVVAVNKIDKPGSNPNLVKQQLADAGLVCEEWGGDTVCIGTSAKTYKGVNDLLENLLVVAELENLRANPAGPAVGTVIESRMDRTRGPIATVLVHDGTLKIGDIVAVGTTWGHVKAMVNDANKRIRRAEPSTPVEILGLAVVPQVGDTLNAVPDEHTAESLVKGRERELEEARGKAVKLENLFEQINAGKMKELDIILRTDVQGSIEPIKTSIEQLSTAEVKVQVVHSGTGNINESDVMLAVASKTLIVGFNTGIDPGARRLADSEGIDIHVYDIIYSIVDDIERALKGMLEPKYADVVQGRAEVKAVFPAGKKQNIAGLQVSEGKIARDDQVRVLRAGKVLAETTVTSMRHLKDDVTELARGFEGGVGLVGFNEFQAGDMLEFYRKERVGGRRGG
jgi:translation initiation factor IF-2